MATTTTTIPTATVVTSTAIQTGIHNPEVKKVVKAALVAVLTVVVNLILHALSVNPALLGGTVGVVYYLASQIEHLIPTSVTL
jgi:Flp pilus assembly protein TadB